VLRSENVKSFFSTNLECRGFLTFLIAIIELYVIIMDNNLLTLFLVVFQFLFAGEIGNKVE